MMLPNRLSMGIAVLALSLAAPGPLVAEDRPLVCRRLDPLLLAVVHEARDQQIRREDHEGCHDRDEYGARVPQQHAQLVAQQRSDHRASGAGCEDASADVAVSPSISPKIPGAPSPPSGSSVTYFTKMSSR